MLRRAAGFLAAMAAIALSGCAGGLSLTPGGTERPAIMESGMEGRWILAAPNTPTCGMTFTGQPAATEGRVTPDGGCPERFFMSRRWRLADGVLMIGDDEDEMLAGFRAAGDHFEGKSGAGTPVTLSR